MYKIPKFNPFPADPPSFKFDSAAILHIGHWADKVDDVKMMNPKTNSTKITIEVCLAIFLVISKIL